MGKKRIDSVFKYPYDCVLMDIQMPVMDGFRATTLELKRSSDTPCNLALLTRARSTWKLYWRLNWCNVYSMDLYAKTNWWAEASHMKDKRGDFPVKN